MAIDYAKLAATAVRLISENGRALSLRKPPQAPADVAKPWGARAVAGAVVVATTGAFFDLEREELVETALERRQQRVLIPPEPPLPEELGPRWQVDDGSIRYDVLVSRPVKPGPVVLYYELVVAV